MSQNHKYLFSEKYETLNLRAQKSVQLPDVPFMAQLQRSLDGHSI